MLYPTVVENKMRGSTVKPTKKKMDKEWIIVKANYARILSTSQKILYPFVILLNLVRQRLKYSSATASS